MNKSSLLISIILLFSQISLGSVITLLSVEEQLEKSIKAFEQQFEKDHNIKPTKEEISQFVKISGKINTYEDFDLSKPLYETSIPVIDKKKNHTMKNTLLI